ncbi:DsrE family protein [uncultured Cytophaga sp.]|uniref:DsrE family protein n=1 Tax=uncultured Cytophaga sp. TaxID=160238 RepID=UPI00261B58E6|nr:DsrE family protein [uncultured Cytophaga sp.]
MYKVVIQLSNNDIAVQKATISQLNNILNAFEAIEVELVMNGAGIDLLLSETLYQNTLAGLHDKGIQFVVCKNTLNHRNLSTSSVLAFARIVPSAIAHLILRQHEGWSYIKAGF